MSVIFFFFGSARTFSSFPNKFILLSIRFKFDEKNIVTNMMSEDTLNKIFSKVYSEHSYEIIIGNRQNSLMLYIIEEKQIFFYNTKIKWGWSFKCRHPNCSALLILCQNRKYIRLKTHNHEQKYEDEYNRLKVVNKMKKFVAETAVLNENKKIRDTVGPILAE